MQTFSMLFSKANTIEINQAIFCFNFLEVRLIFFINVLTYNGF